jgi:hypothetical protein
MRTKESFYTSSPRSKPTYDTTYNITTTGSNNPTSAAITANHSPTRIDKLDHVTDFKANGANLFTMSTKLDNTNPRSKNYESRNIFTILRKNECDILKTLNSNHKSSKLPTSTTSTGALPNTIKIYIKNENKISNYFTKDDFKEPVIMSHSKYTSTFKDKLSPSPTRPASPSSHTQQQQQQQQSQPPQRHSSFAEKYAKMNDSRASTTTKISTSQHSVQQPPQPTPRASSPRSASLHATSNDHASQQPQQPSMMRSYTPTINSTSPIRKESFQELKSKYNLNKLPNYFQPNNSTGNVLTSSNINNNNNSMSSSQRRSNMLHRRRLAKDSSDEYTSFNTLVDEMTHITSDDTTAAVNAEETHQHHQNHHHTRLILNVCIF